MFWKKKRPHPFHVIIVGTAVVLFWRGVWGLLDLYLFPDQATISFIMSLVLGLIILIVTRRLVDELL